MIIFQISVKYVSQPSLANYDLQGAQIFSFLLWEYKLLDFILKFKPSCFVVFLISFYDLIVFKKQLAKLKYFWVKPHLCLHTVCWCPAQWLHNCAPVQPQMSSPRDFPKCKLQWSELIPSVWDWALLASSPQSRSAQFQLICLSLTLCSPSSHPFIFALSPFFIVFPSIYLNLKEK